MNPFFQYILDGDIPNHKLNFDMTKESIHKKKSNYDTDEEWLEEFKQTILLQINDEKFNMDFIGKKMNISRRQIQRKMKRITGKSPKIFIKEIRLLEAKRLLETGAVTSIKELAKHVGFSSSEYFSTQFKKRFDNLPSEFLK